MIPKIWIWGHIIRIATAINAAWGSFVTFLHPATQFPAWQTGASELQPLSSLHPGLHWPLSQYSLASQSSSLSFEQTEIWKVQ